MIPFRLSKRLAEQTERDLAAKDKLVEKSTKAMQAVLKAAVEEVVAHYLKTGRYKEPDLDGMFDVTKSFYKSVVGAAVESCESIAPKRKRLADAPKAPLPEGPQALRNVLRNRRYYQRIMTRADVLTKRAKKEYLEKLRRQFQKVLPVLEIGDMSPRDMKRQIAKAWKAPAARAETIFRTEATRYFASAQVAFFSDSKDIIGFLFDSVRDTSRTPICRCRHGMVLKPGSAALRKNTPPLHYNCRSHLIPLADDAANRKLVIAGDPDKRELVPVMPGFGKG